MKIDTDLLKQIMNRSMDGPYLSSIKERALQRYVSHGSKPDKELLAFMPSSFDWEQCFSDSPQEVGIHDLGGGSWLANINKVPFMPLAPERLLEVFQQPGCLAHVIGAGFTQAHVLYIPPKSNVNIDYSGFLKNSGGAHLLIIVVGEDATVTITCRERFPDGMHARLLMGFLENRARLTFISDQHFSSSAYGMFHEYWHLAQDANLNAVAALTGGKQTVTVRDIVLLQRASCEHAALSVLQNDEQSASLSYQNHRGAGSSSSVVNKVLLTGSSRSFFRGMIRVEKEAPGAQADLQHRALLLSPQAKSCAIPSLEVATQDVQCKHGSGIGQFNQEDMTFLAARGFDPQEAVTLLTAGFFQEPLSRFDATLTQSIKERLLAGTTPNMSNMI